jgi:hypothetical protein
MVDIKLVSHSSLGRISIPAHQNIQGNFFSGVSKVRGTATFTLSF